jgi:transcriptional regulator with XRE-family HTH domain
MSRSVRADRHHPVADGVGGPAYELWLRVERERVRRDWSQEELSRRTGIPPSTINRIRTRGARTSTVNTLADVLGIDRIEAAQLAGLLPPPPERPDRTAARPASVRDAILADPLYTDEQRQALITMVDAIEAANRGRGVARLPANSDDERQAI